jgi:hypothetical protein
MKAYLPVQSPPAVLGKQDMDLPARIQRFLSGLAALPTDIQGELPLLTDIAALCAGTPSGERPDTAASWGPIRRGLNRRYLRIRFVQNELERLNFKKAKPGVTFNDFVFDQIDFSAYKKVSEEEYSLYSPEGLEDFEAPFFMRNFRLSREKTQALINGAYTRIGGFYYIRQEKMLFNPLLMSVLRTLQISLEFVPLFTEEEVQDECRAMLCSLPHNGKTEKDAFFYQEDGPGRLFASLLRALHGVSALHPDGMKTDLSAVQEKNTLLLRGVFHPLNKAYTITLAKSCLG